MIEIPKNEAEKIIFSREQAIAQTGKCPICGAQHQRANIMSKFESELLQMLRRNRIVKRDSCLLCVQKHIGRARVYYQELLSANNSGHPDGTAAVNIKLNHLAILGHLGCAIEECDNYTELQDEIIKFERQYRYEGLEPDWELIASMIVKIEKEG